MVKEREGNMQGKKGDSALSPQEIAESLHPLERAVLPHVRESSPFQSLVADSQKQEIEVMRALQWLANKGLIELSELSAFFVALGANGAAYKASGLPEKRFLQVLADTPLSVDVVARRASLEKQEASACLGLLRGKAAIEITKEKDLTVTITDAGKRLREKESLEEKFLAKKFPVNTSTLAPEERFALESLKRRKDIVSVVERKERRATITALGKKVQAVKVSSDTLDALTHGMLTDGSWKGKSFRRYDVAVNVPAIAGGKRHFVRQAISYAKRVWLDMGFSEMEGPLINTSFWNFDALFTAQDHPVREMQDTFFVKKPASGSLPSKKLVDAVSCIHESGKGARSSGWGGKWSADEAKKNVLRTHTTVLSARTLACLKKTQMPAKFFAVGKCFRNEALDWSHLFEFNQTEGIVVDPDADFSHLLGYLREFFTKMGFPQIRVRPAYFPYTSNSIELDVFHPYHKKWIEFGGAGIFRPEVVIPLLGEDIPVLAWGPGFDRIILDYYGITDIRDLYRNDLKQLREMKMWMR